MRSIIALCGCSGAGKTTLAKLLAERYRYEIVSLAAPIKAMMRALLEYQGAEAEYIDRVLYGDLKNEPSPYLAGRSLRHGQETLGTEWRLTIHTHLWIHILENKIAQSSPRVVIDDMRFMREYSWLKAQPCSVFFVRVERNGLIPGPHISAREFLQIPVDKVVHNNGAPEDTLDQLIEHIAILNKLVWSTEK